MFKFDSNGDIILVHLPGCCNNNNQCAATGCLTESDTNSDSDTVIVADSDSDFEEQMTLYDDKMDIIETISDIGDRIISLGHIRNLGLSVGVFD